MSDGLYNIIYYVHAQRDGNHQTDCTSSFWCELRAVVAVGWLQVVGRLVYWAWECGWKSGGNWFQSKIAVNTTRWTNWFTTNRSLHTLPSHRTYYHTPKPNKHFDPQLATSQQPPLHATYTKKTASVVPPEDGRLTPKTCRGLRHNKVIVKVKVY
jgi:hypothetical protein